MYKALPITGHEDPEGEQMYSSTSTSALDWGEVNATFRPLYPQERPSTHCIGGWLGPRAGLDGCRKSGPPYWDSIPAPSSPYRLAVLTELSRPRSRFMASSKTSPWTGRGLVLPLQILVSRLFVKTIQQLSLSTVKTIQQLSLSTVKIIQQLSLSTVKTIQQLSLSACVFLCYKSFDVLHFVITQKGTRGEKNSSGCNR